MLFYQSSLVNPKTIGSVRDILDGPANSSCFNSEASPWRGTRDRERSDDPSMIDSLYSFGRNTVGDDDFGVTVFENTEIV